MIEENIQNIYFSDFIKAIELLTQTQNKSLKHDRLIFHISSLEY